MLASNRSALGVDVGRRAGRIVRQILRRRQCQPRADRGQAKVGRAIAGNDYRTAIGHAAGRLQAGRGSDPGGEQVTGLNTEGHRLAVNRSCLAKLECVGAGDPRIAATVERERIAVMHRAGRAIVATSERPALRQLIARRQRRHSRVGRARRARSLTPARKLQVNVIALVEHLATRPAARNGLSAPLDAAKAHSRGSGRQIDRIAVEVQRVRGGMIALRPQPLNIGGGAVAIGRHDPCVEQRLEQVGIRRRRTRERVTRRERRQVGHYWTG